MFERAQRPTGARGDRAGRAHPHVGGVPCALITERRIAEGVEFWNKNSRTLERAQRKYGVPPQYVVAIIGVETFYGRNTGNWRVVDALTTLAFDYPPRARFFRSELEATC